MSSLKNIINKLKIAASYESGDAIKKLEKSLSDELVEVSKIPSFYSMPIQTILNVVKGAELDEEDYEKVFKTIVQHIDEKYPNDSALILNAIPSPYSGINLSSLIKIISQLTHSPLCVLLGKLYNEEQSQVVVDYEYQYNQAKKEIKKLKQEINVYENEKNPHFDPIKEKPSDYEKDIFAAARKNKLDSIKWLIEKENVDVNIANSKQETPLHIASQYGHLKIVQYLCQKGADITLGSLANKWQPIHWAAEFGHLDIVKYLVEECHADARAKRADGFTPLHIAAFWQNLGLAQYLFKHGADKDINLPNQFHVTPLVIVCWKCNSPIIVYSFVEHGADINLKCDGTSPIQYAKRYKNNAIASYLKSLGAKE